MLGTDGVTNLLGACGTLGTVSVRDRVLEVLQRTGWSQRELSRRAGLAGSHVSTILTSLGDNVRTDTLRAIARAAGVSEAWMVTGEGVPDIGAASTPDDHAHPPAPAADGYQDPRFNALPNWSTLLAAAQRKAPDVPAWAWAALAEARPMLTTAPTVGMIVDLGRFVVDHMPPPPARR